MKIIKQNWTLIFVSFIILFLELLVIRLIGTEIRIFAYFSNLVLLATFIGLGFGMIINKSLPVAISAVALFLVVAASSTNYIVRWPNLDFKFFSGVTELLAPLSESYIWLTANTYSKSGIIIGFFLLIVLFINLILIFMPLGQITGNILGKHKKPILAYSINIAASLVGMWAFQTFSLSRLTPYFGIVLAIVGLYFLTKDKAEKYLIVAIAIATIVFIAPKSQPEKFRATYWSPYQKLTLSASGKDPSETNPQPEGWYLEVNNVGYMALNNLSEDYREIVRQEFKKMYGDNPPIDQKYSDSYTLPFEFKKEPNNVLIIGAGAGNDAAAAVRKNLVTGPDGLKIPDPTQKIPLVDAVEIDPTIVEIGQKYHHEKPYRDPNVNVIVDDGRSFMEKTDKKYDLVIMSLADSHTLSSSLSNLRLDHYLYTKESFAQIKGLLKDDGILFLTFEVTRPWIGDRLNRGLVDVFNQEPKIFEVRSGGVFGWGGYSFVVSKNPQTLKDILANNNDLDQFVVNNQRVFNTDTQPLTDNWPYLYLDKPRLPLIHVVVALFFGSVLLIARKRILGTNKLNWAMFFWGAAFLLFEFQNVSKASLLFGVTWQTNLFMISAILVLLLFANWTVQKKLISSMVAFLLLIASLVLQILLPLETLNNFGLWQKIVFASLVLNLPLYFGGMIFTDMFAKSQDKANAFGSNFLGAVFGGLAEMLSFLFGIHALLYIVIILYSIGFLASNYIKVTTPKLFSKE